MDVYEDLDEQKQFACRVIADHARATAFSIADGILPGNEGRNYVLRKIMRRAIYQGRHALGFEDAFFYKVTNFVVDQMGEAYPELESHREFIEKMVKLEEERFGNTMTVGLKKLNDFLRPGGGLNRLIGIAEIINACSERSDEECPSIAKVVKERIDRDYKEGLIQLEPDHYRALAKRFSKIGQSSDQLRSLLEKTGYPISDEDLKASMARFNDTYGVPADLVRVSLEEHGFKVDEHEFNDAFSGAVQELQQQAETEENEARTQSSSVYARLAGRARSKFKGYETTRVANARVVALIKGDNKTQSLKQGGEGEAVLDRTPFYAESGGQVGDVGRLINPVATAPGTDLIAADRDDRGTGVPPVNHAQDARATLIATVTDTYSPGQGLIVHKVKVEKGTLKVGDTVTAEVDVEKRDATRRNHTATHLMHAALREVLGTHVKQAGSVVAPNYLRFDFSHYQPLTGAEIDEIERLVNYHILRNQPVQTDEMAVEEAMRSGAMALFGEKYGEKVRVLSIKGAEGIFSKELCGGTHVRATGDIGVFKITSDESIASGVRRIRAVTGVDAYERFREDEQIISQITSDLRTSRAELPTMIGKLQDELKKARREADELKLKIATGAAGQAGSNGDDAREIAGVRVLAREASGLDSAGVRQLSDTLLARIKSGVVVIGRSNDGKASLIVRTSDDLTKRVPAGLVIKELAPIVGGKGGGKADMAEGGGNQPEKLAEALEASYGVIERMLGS